MYKDLLKQRADIDADSYTRQKLKRQFEKHYGNDIVFHQPQDRKRSELLYSSSISIRDVINSAYEQRYSSYKSAEQPGPGQNDRTRLLHHTATLIRSDVSKCQGISSNPPCVDNMSLEASRSAFPDSLYWLLRTIVANPETEGNPGESSSQGCSNQADERRIIMLAQDIVFCASHSRAKMPKHLTLALAIHHLTGSKQLITMFNRLGHCCSYDEVEIMDTSLAVELLARSELYGVVVPSNITPGVFVQAAGDNGDLNENTLDEKRQLMQLRWFFFNKVALVHIHPPE